MCVVLYSFYSLPSSFRRTFLSLLREKGIEKYISSSSTFSNEVFAFVPQRNISIKRNGENFGDCRGKIPSLLSDLGEIARDKHLVRS
jgi:hypothetical protein